MTVTGAIVAGLAAGVAVWFGYVIAADRIRSGLRYRDRVWVYGAWHDRQCLVARYPCERSDPDGFPWCTCQWRRPLSPMSAAEAEAAAERSRRRRRDEEPGSRSGW